MRANRQTGVRLVLGLLLLTSLMAVYMVLSSHSSAGASQVVAEAAGYHKPTGPELSPTGAADAALKYASTGAAPGNVSLRVARGSFARARAALNGQDGVAGPSSSGTASCFPGLACSPAEVEQHEKEQQEVAESAAYMVEMIGTAFSPPSNRLKKGETAQSGEIETIIVDAHTGFPEERTIGGSHPDIGALGPVTELTAVIPSQSATGEDIATASRRVATGSIAGRITGLSATHVLIVLSEGSEKVAPRDEHVVRRTTTNARGKFKINDVLPGNYAIGAPRPRCRGKIAVVKSAKTTEVTLDCR
jgi:hypothetical protein